MTYYFITVDLLMTQYCVKLHPYHYHKTHRPSMCLQCGGTFQGETCNLGLMCLPSIRRALTVYKFIYVVDNDCIMSMFLQCFLLLKFSLFSLSSLFFKILNLCKLYTKSIVILSKIGEDHFKQAMCFS